MSLLRCFTPQGMATNGTHSPQNCRWMLEEISSNIHRFISTNPEKSGGQPTTVQRRSAVGLSTEGGRDGGLAW